MQRAFVAVLVLAAAAVPSAQSDRIRVAVFTAAAQGGFTDQALAERTASVDDLKKALTKKKLQVVDDATQADITLEVLYRTIGDPNYATTYDLCVRLTAGASGNYVTELHSRPSSVSQFSNMLWMSWGKHAGAIADRVNDFAKANKNRLLAQRR